MSNVKCAGSGTKTLSTVKKKIKKSRNTRHQRGALTEDGWSPTIAKQSKLDFNRGQQTKN